MLPALLVLSTGAAVPPPDLTIVTDEAEAVLDILDLRAAGGTPEDAAWARLFATEGYRRLKARELAMGRSFEDSSFRSFVLSDSLLARRGSLRETLRTWRRADLGAARTRALAYLPRGSAIRARVYLLVKPRTNSFVFEPGTNPAVMLYLDPARTRPQVENTIAHELHHIGYAAACRDTLPAPADSALAEARGWLGAFGEGVAMLAAAGGPHIHPHAVSPPEDRARWDRDVSRADRDFRGVEAFLFDILERRLTDPDSIGVAGMAFFGVQGPWYTVGWLMASTIERASGREALVDVLCDPVRLLRGHNDAAGSGPRWSDSLLTRLEGRT